MGNTPYQEYWKNVYQNKVKFASKKDSSVIPWEIKSFDSNIPEVLNLLKLNQGNLLELGCGTGYDSIYFSNQGFDVTAIDISEDVINIAKNNDINHKVEFLVQDFFVGFPNKHFDIIYDRGFLHNYKGRFIEIFQKIYNILTDNGKYIFITGNPNQPMLETCMPPPVTISEVENYSSEWFKIILVKEILFEVDQNYEPSLGYIYVLQKK